MLKDEIMPLTALKAPPENLEMALERIQWVGEHPTRLIGTVWKNIDQLLYCIRHLTDGKEKWEANAAIIMDCGPRLKIYGGYAGTDDFDFAFIVQDMPDHAEVIGARMTTVPEKHQDWLNSVKEILGSGADSL